MITISSEITRIIGTQEVKSLTICLPVLTQYRIVTDRRTFYISFLFASVGQH